MIEQPKRDAGPLVAKWFYAICQCGRLCEVVDGRYPKHTYWVRGAFGLPDFEYPCAESGKLHGG